MSLTKPTKRLIIERCLNHHGKKFKPLRIITRLFALSIYLKMNSYLRYFQLEKIIIALAIKIKLLYNREVDLNKLYFSTMMKKVIFTLVFLVGIASYTYGQSIATSALGSTNLDNFSFVGFDGLGYDYFIKDNVFSKKSETQTWEYKNVALGKISAVDLINPLKIVLFYEDFNTIIIVDNQLNEIQKFNLFDLDSSIFASKVGMAAQNKFWIYNALTQQIILFDYLNSTYKNVGNPVQESVKFTQSSFNEFYWIDEVNNWYSIDIFGKITLLANVPVFDKVQVIDNDRLLFSKGDKLYCLNNVTKTVYQIEIVEKTFENFYFKDQILAIFTDQQIKKYKIKLP